MSLTREQINRYQRESLMRALGQLPTRRTQDELIERIIKNNEKRRKARTGVAV
ncbi:hypothetical protein [Atlantibacter hermannii]|uniref:hypothetical protein n=1 Tax=Atlantibacter hermannii TaxID=565 RepID=UPI0028B0D11A|nr:hypothetical protein [Atlantibacter hermannii]